jgi:pimeloyl-ACP methyl ester carboxylesterase
MNLSATMWFPNVAELAHRYRVYAVDTIGSASRSVASRPLKKRAEFVDWLDDVCDELGIACTHMVGHSHGGWIALNYALSAPERVKRLILLAPAGALVPLAIQFYVRGIPTLLFPVRPLITSFIRWMTAKGFVVQEQFVEQFVLGAKHFRSQIKVLPGVFSDAELRQITVPTLLLLGAQEVIYDPRAASHRAKRLIPNIKVEIIPNSSHGLPMEQPRLVDEHVLGFLGPESDWPYRAA